MVLTTGAESPLVTLFPCTFSGSSPFVSEVPEQPKVSSPPLEEDITNASSTPMILVLSPGPVWAPFQLSLSTTSKLVLPPTLSSIHALWQCTLSLASVPDTLPKTCNSSSWTLVSPPELMESMDTVMNNSIHHVLISPLLGHFEDKSLAFAFISQNELASASGNMIVQFPDSAQLTCPTHSCGK
ncbi:hypothetical protein DSO57_1027012 [Entomophthora muscae]|uniref:Uncharacterized protein n=1 Tax=Entomophthora muscae TaxID=34485 RepID=A0ACC2T2C7_9FUNG|nr:hypothetical protein DSO57_1027012 [Entomophthora muscae]